MAICAFGYTNRILAGTISAGSEVSGLGSGNLQTQQGGDSAAWRTAGVVTSAAGAWFRVDAGAATTWRAFALARTNLTTAATVRWRVGTIASPGLNYDSGTISAGIVAGFGQSILVAPSDITGQVVRCDIDDPANPDGFVSVALAYAGPIWQPSISFSPETSLSATRGNEATQTRSGAAFVSARYYQRAWAISHGAVKAADLWAQLMPMDRVAADGTNVLFIPDPASAQIQRESVFGILETTSDIGFLTPAGDWRTWRGRIAERL